MISLIFICASLAAATPDEAFSVSARIDAGSLVTGQEYDIVIDWKVAEGLSPGGAGVPAPILQIDAPRAIQLSGKVLRDHRELAQNEFLQAPYERLLKESPARIGFKLRKEPGSDDSIGLNILAYIGSEESGEAKFVRRRLELRLAPNASAIDAEPTNSKWGKNQLLKIGDKAATFRLPTANGEKVGLKQYRGKKNVLVTTYRAHW